MNVERRIARLERQLENEVRRRIEAERLKSEFAGRFKTLREERDNACKRLAAHDKGVANLIATIQKQGAVIEELRLYPEVVLTIPKES